VYVTLHLTPSQVIRQKQPAGAQPTRTHGNRKQALVNQGK